MLMCYAQPIVLYTLNLNLAIDVRCAAGSRYQNLILNEKMKNYIYIVIVYVALVSKQQKISAIISCSKLKKSI